MIIRAAHPPLGVLLIDDTDTNVAAGSLENRAGFTSNSHFSLSGAAEERGLIETEMNTVSAANILMPASHRIPRQQATRNHLWHLWT